MAAAMTGHTSGGSAIARGPHDGQLAHHTQTQREICSYGGVKAYDFHH